MKRYPFLIAIFVSVALFSVIGLLGKNSLYADYEVGLLKKPLLLVVFQGISDGYYPWQMITFSGETAKNAFADSEENMNSGDASDSEKTDLVSNTDSGNLQNSLPDAVDGKTSSNSKDNTASSSTIDPLNPTDAASSKDNVNASDASTANQANEGLNNKTSDKNKNIDENNTTAITEDFDSETNATMNQKQTANYAEDTQSEESANGTLAAAKEETQSSESKNNIGNDTESDTDTTGDNNIDSNSTTTANANNDSESSSISKTASNSITPKPKDGNTSDPNLQSASAINSNTSDASKPNSDSSNTNKTNSSKSNSDTSSSTGTTKQGTTGNTQSNTTTTSKDKTASKDKTTSKDKTASKDEATLITYSYETVTKEYFDDALFIGDSRTVGLSEYSELTNATYYADVGLSIYDIFKDKIAEVNGKKYTVNDALKKKQFKKIYIMLGINELGTGTADSFTEEYEDVITEIKKLQPDAIIFVQAIMTVSKEMSDKDKVFNNKNIKERNEHLATLADNNSIFYIDVNEDITDETGGIPSKYTFDNIHLKAAYYKIWQDFLLNHGIVIK